LHSSLVIEDLTCSICLTIFTDPVILFCGHSFCKECITLSLSSQDQCPHCRATVPTEGKCLLTNHILKSLAEKAKEAEKLKKEVADWLCPEHEEKLKLFCVTDQQLACIICRDGEKHEGHKFKPIKEAAASLRNELKIFVQRVSGDIHDMEGKLESQISSQFEEMHEFLRKREDEIKNELKRKEEDAVEVMTERLNAIETASSESRELVEKMTSVLKIPESDKFLKSWTDDKSTTAAKDSFWPKGGNLRVVTNSLCLGPYESHLQFFMWKEMLQVIQPRAEKVSLESNSSDLTVSDDGRILLCTSQNNQLQYCQHSGSYNCQLCQQRDYEHTTSRQYASAFSVNNFCSVHYWEVDVGNMNYWELGLEKNFLKYDCTAVGFYRVNGQKYSTVQLNSRPQKIGIYVNCSSKELSFYDADTMKHIHTMACSDTSMSAYCKVAINSGSKQKLIVCWY
uniref:Uncharacterized protein n=1 Tax=Anabas testudineus TaxID=64144 RepID=A0A7N6ADE3_ANATE